MMEASNGRTLSILITDSFNVGISNMGYMLLGPPSIDITSWLLKS
jgi:hypothetical protein